MEDCVHACNGVDFMTKGRIVTQSCSLLSMAHTHLTHTLTHQSWNTLHDQRAASGSQNKLLTIVSPWSDLGHATTVSRVGWSRMSSKVTQHAGKLKLPQQLCEEFHQIPGTCMLVSVPAFLQPKRS